MPPGSETPEIPGISGVWANREIRRTIGRCPTRRQWNWSSEISSCQPTSRVPGFAGTVIATPHLMRGRQSRRGAERRHGNEIATPLRSRDDKLGTREVSGGFLARMDRIDGIELIGGEKSEAGFSRFEDYQDWNRFVYGGFSKRAGWNDGRGWDEGVRGPSADGDGVGVGGVESALQGALP